MGTVYLLSDYEKEGYYKIGVTNGDVDKRIKKLQTGNGGEIYLVNYHKTQYPFFVEKHLHLRFFKEQKIGEWYELKKEDVFNFKKYCDEIEKLIESLKDNPFFTKNLK